MSAVSVGLLVTQNAGVAERLRWTQVTDVFEWWTARAIASNNRPDKKLQPSVKQAEVELKKARQRGTSTSPPAADYRTKVQSQEV